MKPLSLQPIPYQGSKRALAPRIATLFPQGIETLYEPFAGSAAVSIYAATHGLAKKFVIGDKFADLIELWRSILQNPEKTAWQYRVLWEQQFELGLQHFNVVRSKYNAEREPAQLLYLTARCVKNAVRFNRAGHFTQSQDKRRHGVHPDKMERTLLEVASLLAGKVELFCGDFRDCVRGAQGCDFVYMDPPYQGTSIGPDKRYAEQLDKGRLVDTLRDLSGRAIRYVLSYDGMTGAKNYGDLLPDDLSLRHFYLEAGRSSQSTLMGRDEITLESLYISNGVYVPAEFLAIVERNASGQQSKLFAN